eukprot:scaffold15652_cov151-Isochrysis_galbana.AAC.4
MKPSPPAAARLTETSCALASAKATAGAPRAMQAPLPMKERRLSTTGRGWWAAHTASESSAAILYQSRASGCSHEEDIKTDTRHICRGCAQDD